MKNVDSDSKSNIIIKGEKNSNLELLRILSMILIIAHHYSVHGGWGMGNELSLNRFFIQFLSLGGKLGVNCFVLITGYFMINSKFNVKKLVKIMGQVFFYSATIMILFKVLKLTDIGIRVTIESLFPIVFDQYWFATIYVILYLLSPYINKLIGHLTSVELRKLIIILAIVLSVIPTFTASSLGTGYVLWFVFLYLIGSYLRKYPHEIFEKKRFFLGMFLFGYAFIFLSVILCDVLGIKIAFFASNPLYLSGMDSLPLLFCSVALFIHFKNINIGSNKMINKVSVTTFGIYLIHDNNFIRGYLWSHIAQNNLFYHSKWLYLHAVVTICLVFVVCMLIEHFRIAFIEKPILSLIDTKWKGTIKISMGRKYIYNYLMQHIIK